VKRYYAKMTIHCSRVACFSAYRSSWKQKYLPLCCFDRTLDNSLLRRTLYNKKCIIRTSETLMMMRVLLQCWSDKPGSNKRSARPTAKRAAMVLGYTVGLWRVEILLTCWCS